MIEYNQQYEDEIKKIIKANPRNYVRALKSKGFRGRCPDRTYLVDYIYACTPMLDDDVHDFRTRVYWTINHMSELPMCMNDKNGQHHLATQNIKKIEEGYPMFCNSRCQHEAPAYFQMLKDGMMKKHGVANPFQMEDVKRRLAKNKAQIEKKRVATRTKHFGNVPGWNLKKSIQTRIERYGCAWNQQAVKKTKFLLHGDESQNNPEKNFKTKKRNGTMNTSKSEEMSYVLLVERFGANDILRQYKSEEYPFACDFYIKSRNIYIECNYCWTHGQHPFDPSSDADTLKLEHWKSKGTKYYMNAVDTWTRRDVNKRNAATNAKLNYYAFYDFDDFCTWLECSMF